MSETFAPPLHVLPDKHLARLRTEPSVSQAANSRVTTAYAPSAVATGTTSSPFQFLSWSSIILGLSLGPAVLLMAYAYTYAATHATGQDHFHLFWISVLIFMVPAGIRVGAARTSRGERLNVLALVALFQYLPKFLRDPGYPLYQDELAHWRQAESIYHTGKLFQPNPIITVLQFFPGLHALTVALRELTGLSTYTIGAILMATLHVIALIGVFLIAERVFHSARVAAVAALLYSLNPSFMYFDTQYSYESLAIVFFIWVLVAVTQFQDASTNLARRGAWLVCGLVIAAACTITHHLTTYILVLTLILITGATVTRALLKQESARTAVLTASFTGGVVIFALSWLFLVASDTFGYLAPYLPGGLSEIVQMIGREHQSRALFARSTTPAYERAFAFLSPALAGVATAGGVWYIRRHRPRSSLWYGLVLFGLLYFPSVPFILTQVGNEGARRSWAFTYLGLCLLVAPAAVALLRKCASGSMVTRAALRTSLLVIVSIVLIGNVAMHLNEEYRFPGPYVYGSDTRSLTPEVEGTATWFRVTEGSSNRVLADRYVGMALGSFGDQWIGIPSAGFPVWQLYFQAGMPSMLLIDELRASGYHYMVIDREMVKYLPRVGVYFNSSEPIHSRPPPAAAIEKFDSLPWATTLYASDNLEVLRLDLEPLLMGGYPHLVSSTTRMPGPTTGGGG